MFLLLNPHCLWYLDVRIYHFLYMEVQSKDDPGEVGSEEEVRLTAHLFMHLNSIFLGQRPDHKKLMSWESLMSWVHSEGV